MKRRDFLKLSGKMITITASAPFLIRCGNDTISAGGVTVTSSSNAGHTHTLTISGTQLTTGEAVSLTDSDNGHTHEVNLTAQNVKDIANNNTVTATSSTTNSHSHTYTFNAS